MEIYGGGGGDGAKVGLCPCRASGESGLGREQFERAVASMVAHSEVETATGVAVIRPVPHFQLKTSIFLTASFRSTPPSFY